MSNQNNSPNTVTEPAMSGKSKPPRKKSDELLKGAFEENFADFLCFVYPDAMEIVDFSKGIEFMDKELFAIIPERERKKDKRVADLLVKLYLKDGTEKWVLLNVEIEGGDDKEFAYRLYQYHYRIRDRFGVSAATIAVFTGNKNQKRPVEYKEELLGTVLSFKYTSYHVFDHSQEMLINSSNPFALIVLACQKALLEGKIPDEELSEERLTIVRALIKQNYNRDRILTFVWFLKNFIFIDNEDINLTFDRETSKLIGGDHMNILETLKMQERREGKIEGRYQEALEIAHNLKKEGLSSEFIAKTTKLSIQEIESL